MKNSKKIVSLSLAATMLASTGTAFAALPDSTLVIGSDAFNVLELSNLTTEIDAALNKIEGDVSKIYYDLEGDSLDGYYDLDGKVKMTDEVKTELGEITLHKADGTTEKYENIDAETPVAQADLTAYNAALAKVAEADYTAESWAAYQVVVKDNMVTGSNTQAEVDAATANIKAAQANLVSIHALEVESVSAINLKQVEVKFNQEVDKNTITTTTVKMKDGATDVALSNIKAELKADKMTMIVYYDGAANNFTQRKDYKVVINGVKGTDATKKITNYEKVVTPIDSSFPEIVNVDATTTKTIEVVFNEPVKFATTTAKVWDEFLIDGIKAYASIDDAKLETENKIVLTLGTALTAGEHTVKFTGINDFAGLPIADTTKTVTAVNDAAAPTIQSAVIKDSNTIEITFDEPVTTASVNTNLKVTKSDGTLQAVTVDTNSGNVVTASLSAGSFGIINTAETKITYANVADLVGNKVAANTEYKFAAADDDTKPTVSVEEVKTASNNVVVVFDEKVDTTTAQTNTNYKLYKADGTTFVANASSATIVTNSEDKKVELAFTSATSYEGAYVLKITNVKDDSIRQNVMTEAALTVTFNDISNPSLSGKIVGRSGLDLDSDGSTDDAKLTIKFDKAMDPATLTNLSNYLVDGDGSTNGAFDGGSDEYLVSTVTGATAVAATDNKSVVITLPNKALTLNTLETASTAVAATDSKVKVYGVKDSAGNNLATSDLGAAKDVYNFAGNFTLANIKATAKNTVVLTANEGYTFKSIDPNGIKFEQSNGTEISVLQVTGAAISADGKTATLSLNNALAANAEYSSNAVHMYVTGSAIKDSQDRTIAIADNSGKLITDQISPALLTTGGLVATDNVAPTKDVITVSFDEELTANPSASDFLVKDPAGITLTPGTDYTVARKTGDNTKVEITLENTRSYTNAVFSVAYNGVTVGDAIGNKAQTFALTSLPAGTSDAKINTAAVAPTTVALSSESLDTNADGAIDTVKVKFNQAMDWSNLRASDFVVRKDGNAGNYNIDGITNSGDDMAVLTVSGQAGYTGAVEVVYTKNTTTSMQLKSAGGVAVETVPDLDLTDKAAPAITAYDSYDNNNDGNTDGVVFTFSEAVTDAEVTAAVAGFKFSDDDFTTSDAGASIDTNAQTFAGSGYADVANDKYVVVKFTPSAVQGTGAIKWSYTDDGTNHIDDTANNIFGSVAATAAVDKAKPVIKTVVNAQATPNTNDVITFTFSEALTGADIDNVAKYAITSTAGTIKADGAANNADQNGTIAIDNDAILNNDKIAISGISDAAGNAINTAGDTVTFTDVTDMTTAAKNTID